MSTRKEREESVLQIVKIRWAATGGAMSRAENKIFEEAFPAFLRRKNGW